jgi:hypothetical protein
MQDNANSELPAPKRMLWNKGKLTGAKPQNPRHSSERSSQNPIVDLGKPQAPQIQERKSLIFLPRKNPRSNSSTATASSRRAPPLPKEVDPVLALLLNVLWILFGGLWMAVGWAIAGVLMAITIIGLPWTRAAFTIAAYTLLPFGQKAVSRDEYFGREDLSTGPLGVIGNIIMVRARGLVVGARPCRHRDPLRRHHHWHSLRVGAFEARRHCPLAYRQGHRSSLVKSQPEKLQWRTNSTR